jgi:hypothetical protein
MRLLEEETKKSMEKSLPSFISINTNHSTAAIKKKKPKLQLFRD